MPCLGIMSDNDQKETGFQSNIRNRRRPPCQTTLEDFVLIISSNLEWTAAAYCVKPLCSLPHDWKLKTI